MASFGVVVGNVVADFKLGFGQVGEVTAVEQLGFEAAPKRFGVGVIVAVAQPAIALQRPTAGKQLLKADGRVLAALVGVDNKPGRGPARARRKASLTRSTGIVSRTSQPTTLREQRSSHTARYSQPPPWRGK